MSSNSTNDSDYPAITSYPIAELKTIYHTLQQGISLKPELMDSDLLQDLQTYLQKQAKLDGIDISLHAQWATWLNGGTDLRGI